MKLNKVRLHNSDIIKQGARLMTIDGKHVTIDDGPDHEFVFIHPEDEHMIVRNGVTENCKVFKVFTVSSNTNSFGLYGHILVAKDGETWQAGASMYNKKTKGDLVQLYYTKAGGSEFNWALAQFEIPEKLPNCPNELIEEIWKS